MNETVSMQMMIDAIPVGVHVVDARGILVEVNRAWLIHFGVTADRVLGRPIGEIMRDMIYFDRSDGKRADDPWEFESPAALETLKTRLPSRASFHQGRFQTTARPILDRKGDICYVVTTMTETVRETCEPAHRTCGPACDTGRQKP